MLKLLICIFLTFPCALQCMQQPATPTKKESKTVRSFPEAADLGPIKKTENSESTTYYARLKNGSEIFATKDRASGKINCNMLTPCEINDLSCPIEETLPADWFGKLAKVYKKR